VYVTLWQNGQCIFTLEDSREAWGEGANLTLPYGNLSAPFQAGVPVEVKVKCVDGREVNKDGTST